jgi:hypothetical protein
MAVTAHQQLLALTAKHNLTDEELLPIIAGYADIVILWLEQPCLPGTLPMSFAEFLQALDRSLAGEPEAG